MFTRAKLYMLGNFQASQSVFHMNGVMLRSTKACIIYTYAAGLSKITPTHMITYSNCTAYVSRHSLFSV